jgi:hypothetical protein
MTMRLSTGFQIDPHVSWVDRHNREVREVWNAFQADKPIRVPVEYTGARILYCEQGNLDWSQYYEDPNEMIRIQLESARYHRELPFGDHVLAELPAQWDVAVDFHPVGTLSCFGCPLQFRPNAVPANGCLRLSREECRTLPMPDIHSSGLLPRYAAFTEHFDRRCAEGLRFLGRPVRRLTPTLPSKGGGAFSMVLDIRGPEIMSDMYEEPEFVHAFLERIAEWRIDLYRAWYYRDGLEFPLDTPGKGEIVITDHGIDMLSTGSYDAFLGSMTDKLCRKYGQSPAARLHHCGHGTHLFPLMRKRYGFTTLHGLTWPLNDVGRVRRELGYDIWIVAVIADSILQQGPNATREAVRKFLTPEVKGSGRLSLWIPGEVAGIPPASYQAMYEAVKEFGKY